MTVLEEEFVQTDLLSKSPTNSLGNVLVSLLRRTSNYRHAIFYPLLLELGQRTDIANPEIEQLVGLVIHKAIQSDSIDSLIEIFHSDFSKKYTENFYPGIVTYCVKRALVSGADSRIAFLWSAALSPKIFSNDDNVKFSLLALQKLRDMSPTNNWLSDLALQLANISIPSSITESQFLGFALISYNTISKFDSRQFELVGPSIRKKILADLQIFKSFLIRSEDDKWASAERLIAIGSGYPTQYVVNNSELYDDASVDSIIAKLTGIDWLGLIETMKRLEFADEDEKTFPGLVIMAVSRNSDTLFDHLRHAAIHRNFRRFLILYSLADSSETSRKIFFRFPVEIVADSDCELLRLMSGLCVRKFSSVLCPTSSLISEFKEPVFDSIVRGISEGTCDGPEIGGVVTELIRAGLDDSLLIDLTREILARFSPRTAPLWAMELLLEIAKSLAERSGLPKLTDITPNEPDESTLLAPSELMALELIDSFKYFIDLSEHEDAKNDPITNANICFVKSVFALRTIGCCLKIFIGKYPQIFIVKLCDIWPMLEIFLPWPAQTCKWTSENELRFLFGLELVDTVTDSSNAIEFFKKRIHDLLVPLVTSYPKDRFEEQIGQKIFPLVNKLEQSGLLPNLS